VKDIKINKSSKNIYQSIKYLSPELKNIIFIFSLFSLANFGLASFLLLKLNSITESLVISLSIYTVFSLVTAIFSKGMGKLSDQLGRKRIIAIGYSLFIFTCLGLAYLNSFIGVSVLFLLYGIVFAMVEPTQKAYISDYSEELKGTSLGFYHFSRGIAMIVGGLIAGLIWDISPSSMFIYLAIIGFIALTVMKKHLYSAYGKK
jgi:MFS family permease